MNEKLIYYHASHLQHAVGTLLIPSMAEVPEVGDFHWRTDRVWLAIDREEAEEWGQIMALTRNVSEVFLYRVQPLTRIYLSLDPSTDLMQASTSKATVLELLAVLPRLSPPV
jgi:hypothetical protein